jgi:hypothetical protein
MDAINDVRTPQLRVVPGIVDSRAASLLVPNTAAAAPVMNMEQVPNDLLTTYILCLLDDRGERSDLGRAFIALVAERHRHFHVRHSHKDEEMEQDWRRCKNPVCVEAAALLESASRMDCTFSSLTLQRIGRRQLGLEGKPGMIRVYVNDGSPKVHL